MNEHPYLTFGPANDGVGLAALVLGLLAFAAACVRGRALATALERVPSRWFVGACAFGAAALSTLYLTHYLRGGPRIIDATAYFLEGRTLASGHFSFDVPDPSGSFRGRFLLPTPDGRLSVIFPPGYPALLALGFLAGAPLAVGPLLAAALVFATYFCSRTLLGDERVARASAVISMLCGVLRYHTADTMSHGLSALLFALALGLAARRTKLTVALAGLALGFLVATRPVTGAAAAAVTLLALRRDRTLMPILLGALAPGLALLVGHARAATGSVFGSPQLAYYALSDGPPGCFRYGFGAGVGCHFEHGDFVRQHLANGFGALAAARVTLERLVLHGTDIANCFPLALLVPWAAARFRGDPAVRTLALVPVLVVLAYAPFYFPGSYPGAGARLLADALPVEHVLLAFAAVRLRVARFVPAAMLLGFGLHAVHQHVALAEREGGRPMFEERRVEPLGRSLVFVGTDHGFLLGHDPSGRPSDPLIARRRGDAHDRVLWERLGRPPSYRYDYDLARGTTRIFPYVPEATTRFETEAEWPVLSVRSGWAHPDFRRCLSHGQGLHLRAAPRAGSSEPLASVEVELISELLGPQELWVGWLADSSAVLSVASDGARASLRAANATSDGGCFRARALAVEPRGTLRVRLETPTDVIVDYLELTPSDAKRR